MDRQGRTDRQMHRWKTGQDRQTDTQKDRQGRIDTDIQMHRWAGRAGQTKTDAQMDRQGRTGRHKIQPDHSIADEH